MQIKDPRYDYHITVSVHIIIENNNHQILLAKRPDNWEWAPGRWGLPGGKLYQHESFLDAIKRKTKQELGFILIPEGLYQLKQLIIQEKQAHMYFFAARYKNEIIKGEMVDYGWFSINELQKKPINIFSEFFYKQMLSEYLSKKERLFPITQIEDLNYIKLVNTKKYKEWFEGIINKNYDPTIIKDFNKWKKKKGK